MNLHLLMNLKVTLKIDDKYREYLIFQQDLVLQLKTISCFYNIDKYKN